MQQKTNPFLTLFIVIAVLIGLDIVFNQARVVAGFLEMATSETAVEGQNLQNNIAAPDSAVPPTTAPLPVQPATGETEPGLTITIIDGDEPVIRNLVPIPPATTEPSQQPEAIINWADELSKPTATPRALSDEKLLACVSAQQDGRRQAPYCPANAAELLGPGR